MLLRGCARDPILACWAGQRKAAEHTKCEA